MSRRYLMHNFSLMRFKIFDPVVLKHEGKKGHWRTPMTTDAML